jgi:very-short-patch-repair endonuclease
LGVEADGGQHGDERARQYDQQRSDTLGGKGIRIIRFSDDDILKYPEVVQEMIYRELTGQEADPIPQPPPLPSPGVPGAGEKIR